MAKQKTIHYILLVNPYIVNMQDLITQIPGFQYPKPIRIIRVRPELSQNQPPLQLYHLTSTEVKDFSNLNDLITELEKHKARKEELEEIKQLNKN